MKKVIFALSALCCLLWSESAQAQKVVTIWKDGKPSTSVEPDSVFFWKVPAEAIDLGLPSGTKWASCNVGATKPEEYGDYFAWGETQSKDVYNWSTYQYCNGLYNTMTKYCIHSNDGYNGFTDGLTELLPEDDAATANWGGSWKMPTFDQIKELLDNCSSEWTQLNGVNGRKFTGSNGNSIFLPAAGYRWSDLRDEGSDGEYWSRSLHTSHSYNAYRLNFDSGHADWDSYVRRFGGLTVRPVSDVLQATIKVEPMEIRFGDVPVGTTKTEHLTVSNIGTRDLTISLNETHTLFDIPESGQEFTLAPGEEKVFDVIYTPTEVGVQSSRIVSINSNAENGTQTVSIYGTGSELPPSMTPGQAIDLGLPSGTKWASCNVGATKPEEHGLYFAWGETQGYTGDTSDGRSFNWGSYKWCNGSYDTMTKYCTNSSYGYNGFTDDLTELLPEDDAATANWGSDWRMPTFDQIIELHDNCSSEWTQINGVNGRKFTGSNGNSIFLPAAGYRLDASLYSEGSNGHYWSRSLGTSYSNFAYYLVFGSGDAGWGSLTRHYGFTVRPVSDVLQATIKVEPMEIRFGDVPVGTTKTEHLTVSNTGTGDLTFSLNETHTLFDIPESGQEFTLAPGEEKVFDVIYTPTEVGVQSSRVVTINSNAENGIQTVSIYGTGSELPPSMTPGRAIDLGLPSGTKWASCNVGATKPEEYGGYYAWGETNEKDYYDASRYEHAQIDEYGWSVGNGPCYNAVNIGSNISGTQYDAATANWGGSWKMPTLDQIKELIDNCSSEWTQINDVNGRKFTGPNGNSIFLPAAGSRCNDSFNDVGSIGQYWSCSLSTELYLWAHGLAFHFRYGGNVWSDVSDRYCGRSVRPVLE